MRYAQWICAEMRIIMEKAIKKYWPVFLLPTMAAFTIGFIVPFIEGIYLSFCKFTTIKDASFVGFSNYAEAFKDSTFPHAFGFTAIFAVVTLILVNLLAFALALALTQKIKGTNIFRTIFFMPNLIGGIVLGYIWQLIFDGIFSKFDMALKLNAKLGFWGLVILICWQQIGYMMIVYIAGLQAIPDSLKEAAMIDGCNPIQTFFLIVLPLLKPIAITIAILNVMWIWNDYLLPYLLLGTEYKTIPIAVQYLRGGYGAVDMGAMMAILVLAIIPIVIFYLTCQKHIIEGIAAGAVKG